MLSVRRPSSKSLAEQSFLEEIRAKYCAPGLAVEKRYLRDYLLNLKAPLALEIIVTNGATLGRKAIELPEVEHTALNYELLELR